MSPRKEDETQKTIRMTDLEESERPCEKLLTLGPRALTKTELMAIQLRTGIQGTNALELAHQLLSESGNNLYTLYQDLKNGLKKPPKGLGEAKIANILACLELGIRTMHDKELLEQEDKVLNNSQLIYNYIFPDLYNLPLEELWLILFNQQTVPRRKIRISIGGISNSTADLRVILNTALRLGFPALALVHNHPGGSITPSSDDDNVTERLFKACHLVGLTMLDHIIFTDKGYYSYFDSNRFLSWL